MCKQSFIFATFRRSRYKFCCLQSTNYFLSKMLNKMAANYFIMAEYFSVSWLRAKKRKNHAKFSHTLLLGCWFFRNFLHFVHSKLTHLRLWWKKVKLIFVHALYFATNNFCRQIGRKRVNCARRKEWFRGRWRIQTNWIKWLKHSLSVG